MICYLGFGANLGERERTLRRAIEYIKKIPAVKLLRVSSFYESEAWGVTNQPPFVNAAIKISTELEPPTLLDELQRIELELGRIRREHWGERTIDIDILFIEGQNIFSERLIVPHEFLFERDFALIPLKEIFPSFECKLHGDKVSICAGSPTDFNFKLIACVDKNFGLGYKNKLLFQIPADLKNFRRLTLNHTIIYGRKTLETFPNQKPLDKRRNIILSRTLEKISGAEVVDSIEKLFDILDAAEENFIVGGAQIFDEMIPYAEEIFLTVVDAKVKADSFFPNIDEFTLQAAQVFDGFEFRRYTR
ncbi:MAG: 2-amino-4-hydroxy-6-hydroxymethyldihydropteridine diphosphokinase [Selenomonadaceae bacterium]|nr:2-amino-4-hydroxy-6-hydroxymethyldihydropteridine diphosphokinase [Selenomonadaceae bacterium]